MRKIEPVFEISTKLPYNQESQKFAQQMKTRADKEFGEILKEKMMEDEQ